MSMPVPSYAPTDRFQCNSQMPTMPMSSAPPLNPAFNPQVLNLISQIGTQLSEFMLLCDSTLNNLYSAQNTEVLDSGTNNWSLFGWFVSHSSHVKNHAVANEVDDLRQRVLNINHSLTQLGNVRMLLPMSLDGNAIRMAENAEHNFLANWFTSNAYSSYASTNTLSQIGMTIQQVRHVRNVAQDILFFLSTQGNQSGQPFMAQML